MAFVVDAEWLKKNAGKEKLAIVDASFFLPDHHRDAAQEYRQGHIPGAVFLDLVQVADHGSGLPSMLPDGPTFTAAVEALGIDRDGAIVVYDNSPLHSAARGWWMFRVMGAPNVLLLDGGLRAWKEAGGALEQGWNSPGGGHFPAAPDKSVVRTLAAMLENVQTAKEQVADARSPGRFSGADPEPRAGMRSGHIPGACNLPHGALYQPDGRLKDREALRAAFAAAGIDPGKPLVASCGSGITASSIVLAATVLGAPAPALYDGSWAEWGARADTPVATGA